MQQLGPADVRRRVVSISESLWRVAHSTYGPLGRAHVLQANAQCADALTITSVAERYLAQIRYRRRSVTWHTDMALPDG